MRTESLVLLEEAHSALQAAATTAQLLSAIDARAGTGFVVNASCEPYVDELALKA